MFTIFLHPFHSAGLRGLDICHRKPLIVTGSDDQTIRVWNYRSHLFVGKSKVFLFPRSFGMELAKKFREEIHSVAIHPDGLYVAAGFIDKIRFLNLLIDDMRLFQVRCSSQWLMIEMFCRSSRSGRAECACSVTGAISWPRLSRTSSTSTTQSRSNWCTY